MKDFATNYYCNYLWISDILSLKSENSYLIERQLSYGKIAARIQNVSIIGTIVETKQVGDKGFLLTVDDGTGVIICKHSDQQFNHCLDIIESEYVGVLSESMEHREKSSVTSFTLNKTEDDTVFNDNTLQNDEISSNRRNYLLGLQSLWQKLLDGFNNCLANQYNIGDMVYVQGRLYTYFNVNQIYVNNIRHVDLKEKVIRLRIKSDEDHRTATKPGLPPQIPETTRTPKRRFSGNLTFDHIHHLEIKLPPAKFITPKRKSEDADHFFANKRTSVVSPHLDGAITFDTYVNQSQEYDGDEIM